MTLLDKTFASIVSHRKTVSFFMTAFPILVLILCEKKSPSKESLKESLAMRNDRKNVICFCPQLTQSVPRAAKKELVPLVARTVGGSGRSSAVACCSSSSPSSNCPSTDSARPPSWRRTTSSEIYSM